MPPLHSQIPYSVFQQCSIFLESGTKNTTRIGPFYLNYSLFVIVFLSTYGQTSIHFPALMEASYYLYGYLRER